MLEFEAYEFDRAWEALQYADACGWTPILFKGKHLVVRERDVVRIAAAGLDFAHLVDHEMPDGSYRIMTIPVND